MNAFYRKLVFCLIVGMVLGMVNAALSAPLSRENSVLVSNGGRFETIQQERERSSTRLKGPSGQRCWNDSSQGADLFLMTLNESPESDCSRPLGEETAKLYAPGCGKVRASGHRMRSGRCAADEQLVTNYGNLIVHSSDQVLGRVDISMDSSGSQDPLSVMPSMTHQDPNSWKKISPSMVVSQTPIATVFRYDRMSQALFDGKKDAGVSLVMGFDRRLVMSGKLAHLVPKEGQTPRTLEFGDLVVLLLLAMLPEKKHIKYFIHRTRQLRLF